MSDIDNQYVQDPIDAPETLDQEKALVLAALAACAWCARTTPHPHTGHQLLAALMEASAWASRARRHRNLEPISVAELTNFLSLPVSEWIPGAGAFLLVDDGEPTAICLEYADEAGSSALEEIEQQVIKRVMGNIAGRADAAQMYTTLRRFLVEHAHATKVHAAKAVRPVGLDLGHVYGPVAGAARLTVAAQEVFYPCPRCGWPMTVRHNLVSCERSASCLADGARFRVDGEGLVALGRLAPPKAVACDGAAALLPGIWRSTVLPGLEELSLADRLARISGAQVELWPYVDTYDIDVRVAGKHWRVDVKDHVWVMRLARHLSDRPAREPTWIVVPDRRREQVPILMRNVPLDAGYSFTYSSELVRQVKGAA